MNEIAKANEITEVNDLPQVNKITKDTKLSAILEEYGDITDVMEAFWVKRVGRYSLRRMITKALTAEIAARIHRVPID